VQVVHPGVDHAHDHLAAPLRPARARRGRPTAQPLAGAGRRSLGSAVEDACARRVQTLHMSQTRLRRTPAACVRLCRMQILHEENTPAHVAPDTGRAARLHHAKRRRNALAPSAQGARGSAHEDALGRERRQQRKGGACQPCARWPHAPWSLQWRRVYKRAQAVQRSSRQRIRVPGPAVPCLLGGTPSCHNPKANQARAARASAPRARTGSTRPGCCRAAAACR